MCDYLQPVQIHRHQSIREILLGLAAVIRVLLSHGTHYVIRHRVSGHPHPVTEIYRAVLGGRKVVVLSQLILPISITLAGRILMLSACKAFLLSDVWIPTLLVLFRTGIGDTLGILSVVMIVSPTGALGRQRTPFVTPNGAVNVWLPHHVRREGHLMWVREILLSIPPVVNPRWSWDYIGLYLRIQSTAPSHIIFSFAPIGVRQAMVIPRILASHGLIGVVFNFQRLGGSVHFLGLKATYPSRGGTSVTDQTPVQIGVMSQNVILVQGVGRGGVLCKFSFLPFWICVIQSQRVHLRAIQKQ